VIADISAGNATLLVGLLTLTLSVGGGWLGSKFRKRNERVLAIRKEEEDDRAKLDKMARETHVAVFGAPAASGYDATLGLLTWAQTARRLIDENTRDIKELQGRYDG